MWAPDYVDLDEIKNLVDVEDEIDDAFLGLLPSATSRAIDRCAGRQFGIVDAPEERTYEMRYSSRSDRRGWYAPIDDLRTTTGLVLPNGITSGYKLFPKNAPALGKAWTHILFTENPTGDDPREFAMTALWGWESIPDAVKLASLLQANRWSSRKDSPFGISGSPDQGGELRLLAKVDPDVKTSLAFYIREWWAA